VYQLRINFAQRTKAGVTVIIVPTIIFASTQRHARLCRPPEIRLLFKPQSEDHRLLDDGAVWQGHFPDEGTFSGRVCSLSSSPESLSAVRTFWTTAVRLTCIDSSEQTDCISVSCNQSFKFVSTFCYFLTRDAFASTNCHAIATMYVRLSV